MSDAGYLSDVPTHNSNAASEISQDLINSTKILENHFKVKYQSLRAAYEQRIKQFNEVILKLYHTISQDEILQQMKQDPTSSLYIPIHFQEIIQQHLTDEREQYLQETLQKNYLLETELIDCKKSVGKWMEERKQWTERQQSQETQFKQKIAHFKQSLKEKNEECLQLQSQLQEKILQVQHFEQSFQQSSHELMMIEGLEQQEQQLRKEMTQQLSHLKQQRDQYQQEILELKSDYRILNEKYQHVQQQLAENRKQEESQHQKFSSMMTQVETLLEQEMNESNQAISIANDKLKSFRSRMMNELHRERRLTAALQEELNATKTVKDEQTRDYRQASEENRQLRDKILQEQQRSVNLESEISSLREKFQDIKMKCQELETSLKICNQQLQDSAQRHFEDLQTAIEKAKKEAREKIDEEQRLLQQKSTISKLQYENELQKLNHQMRHSYSLGTSPVDVSSIFHHPGAANEVIIANQFHDLNDEISFRKLIQQLQQEKQELLVLLQNQEKQFLQQYEKDYEQKIAALRYEWKLETNEQIQPMKLMLQEASLHIEKLKQMVKEGKTVIQFQKDRIEQLRQQMTNCSQENLSLRHSAASIQQHFQDQTNKTPKSTRSDRTTKLYSPSILSTWHLNDSQGAQHSADNASLVTPSHTSYHQQIQLLSEHSQDYAQRQYQNENHDTANNSIQNESSSEAFFREPEKQRSAPPPMRRSSSASHPRPAGSVGTGKTGISTSTVSIKSQISRNSSIPASSQSKSQGTAGTRSSAQPPQQRPSSEERVQQTQTTSFTSQSSQHPEIRLESSNVSSSPALLLTTALEEARTTKLVNLQLQQDKEQLKKNLLELQHRYEQLLLSSFTLRPLHPSQANRLSTENSNLSSVLSERVEEKKPFAPSVQPQSQPESQPQFQSQSQSQSHNPPNHFFETDEPVDDLTFSTFNNPSPQRFLAQEDGSHERQRQLTVDSFTQVEFLDFDVKSIGVNTVPQTQLVELQDQNEQLTVLLRSMDEKVQYEKKLHQLTKDDLQQAQARNYTSSQQVIKLKQICLQVRQQYHLTCHQLRTTLANIKSQLNSYSTVFYEDQKQSAVAAITLQLTVLWKLRQQTLEQHTKAQQKQFLSIYQEEKEELQRQFLGQIQKLQISHQKELEKVIYQSSHLKAASPTLTITATTEPSVAVNAFESTLQGTLQGMLDQAVIAKETSDRIKSIAREHHEPSYAAIAAARGLIGEEIDKFIFGLLQKKYFPDGSVELPAITEEATLSAMPQQSPRSSSTSFHPSSSSYFPANPVTSFQDHSLPSSF